jgi:hypothetical protein
MEPAARLVKIADEILTTERNYCRDLRFLLNTKLQL